MSAERVPVCRSPTVRLGDVDDGLVTVSGNSPALPLLVQHCVVLLTERIRTALGPSAELGPECGHELVTDGCTLSFQASVSTCQVTLSRRSCDIHYHAWQLMAEARTQKGY